MRAPSAGELLDLWEAGFTQAPTERALAFLAASGPERSRDVLASLSIGSRDARLLRLREMLWGSRMEALVSCGGCRERLELMLDAREMLSGSRQTEPGEIALSVAGFEASFRLPTSFDLMAAAAEADPEDAHALILGRCLISLRQSDNAVAPEEVPPEVVAEIVQRMADADPLADIQLDLTCPACGSRSRAVFDIVSFLWTELEVWARRMLTDVHTLAREYGWSERDNLALSPTRRQFYLDMVGA